jgi:hypothetical protein
MRNRRISSSRSCPAAADPAGKPPTEVQASFDILEQQKAAIGRRAPVVDQG